MPEGHSVHRIADEQQELVGQVLRVTSPQGRFSTEAASIDNQRLTSVEAHGKHLLHGFGSVRHLHVHLGMQGKYLRSDPERHPSPKPGSGWSHCLEGWLGSWSPRRPAS